MATPLPESSTFSYDFSSYYNTALDWTTDNFVTRGCSSLVNRAYSAEQMIGDGAAHYSSVIYNYTVGETGLLTNMTRAAGRQMLDVGQSASGFLNSTRHFINQNTPTVPDFLRNNTAINTLSGAVGAAGTTFSEWVSNMGDFLSSSGDTLSSAGGSIGSYGESVYSFFLAVGNKLQSAHQSGSLYKIAPLALGSIFAYFGLKSLTRGTVGYDSMDIRKKMVHKALNEKELSFGSRMALVRDSFFGTMPGKRRAIILARSIASLAAAALLIYPLFVKSPAPNTDLENIESSNFRDQYLDSAASLEPRAEEAHRLHTASQMYISEKDKFDHALSKSKIDPKVQCFVEEMLNPIPSNVTSPAAGSMKERVYDWTIGKSKGFFAPCRNFATPGHQTIFSEAENGATQINATRLSEVCAARKAFIAESPKPLGIQFSDFLGSTCNATLGYTPWSSLCSKMREGLGKPVEQDRSVMNTAVTTMCDTLSKRGGSALPLERQFMSLPDNKDPKLIEALAQRNEDAESLNEMVKDPTKMESFKHFVEENGPEFREYLRGFFNISNDKEFGPKELKRAYKKFSVLAHPDKCPTSEKMPDCNNLFSAAGSVHGAFQENPALFEACKGNLTSSGGHNYYYTTAEMWQNLKDAFNPYSGTPAEEESPEGFKPPTFTEVHRIA